MNPLSLNLYLVKEKVGFMKASNQYQIFNPETGEQVLASSEPRLGLFTKMMRFTDYKRMTPFNVAIRDMPGNDLVHVKRGWTFFRSVVQVFNADNQLIGSFKQKMISFTPKFIILDEDEQEVCELKGKWHGWDFKFVAGDTELAQITKKWAGIGKEMFTSADNYVLKINEKLPADSPIRSLIFAAVMTIDLVLRE
jgi:uncharacterized protein YxjI